jgi:Zn finger protein HypA/HybF involved in hydrogenase expression
MKCIVCNQYFKQSVFNQGYECDNCIDVLDEIDSESEVDIEILKNPSGKTAAQIHYEWDDSHGF